MFKKFWKRVRAGVVNAPLIRGRVIRARYDVAETTPDNYRHWEGADGLSANAAASTEVRRTLRNRSRYEVANNSYARGIVSTLANDIVGTGPRLQMLLDNADANRYIERRFTEWSSAIGLAAKLRTMRMARAQDGEAFAMLTSNPELACDVKLDLRLIEADQVTTPDLTPESVNAIDGIQFDAHGNPTEYHVLKQHPGDMFTGYDGDYLRVPASAMIHYFREERPGQARGIPDITPALPLFAQLRRFTQAVLTAAETAADFAAVLYTDAPAGGEADSVEPLDQILLEKGMATTLPGGWDMRQFKAEQPASTYGEFKREILCEIARCLNMPYNVAAGNSSSYNYASGRLDTQLHRKSISVDRACMHHIILDRLFEKWLAEAALVDPILAAFTNVDEPTQSNETQPYVYPQTLSPQADREQSEPEGKYPVRHAPRDWFWDGVEHVDPAKEANAQATRLGSFTTTLAIEYARQGRDWEDALRQRAKEVQLVRELHLNPEESLPLTPDEEIDEEEQDQKS